MPVKIAVVTVSDRCSAGQATDESGPLAVRLLSELVDPQTSEAPTIVTALVPDEIAQIQNVVMRFADIEGCNLVVTTGGTGFAVRDVTPEAITPLLTKQAPGLMHAITSNGLSKTPFAWLSRGVAGVRNSTVIFTLPGSKKAVQEGLEPLIGKGLYHALELARGVAESPHPSALNPARDHKDSSLTEPIRVPDPTTRARQSEYPMITMTEALAAIEQYTPAPKCTSVHTAAATGLVLAEPVTAAFPQPPFRASVKDGYAVLSADGPGVYRVTGSLCAGSTVPAGYLLKAGETCRVNTGGPIPSNADAVVQVEDTELLATEGSQEVQIRVKVRVSAGHDIRAIGCDMETGGVAVEAGSVIGPAEVGLALSVGATSVKVYRKPCVAVLSTGDELAPIPSVASHQSLPPPVDKIYDSNRGMLIAAAAEHASKVVDAGIARDEMNDTRRKLEAAFANADIVISTGGVSMGEVDCVKAVLLEMGATIHFGRVNMKPGKPTTFASLNGKLFFALPGNPVSAMVCFYVFVVPSLLRWRGSSTRSLPLVRAQLTHDVKLDKERPEYHRCHLTFSQESHFTATSTGIQASHRLLSLAGANGLMVLPAAQDGLTSIARGQTISVVVIGPIQSTLLS